MAVIKYKKRKINNSYLVWFENSNEFVQLEEPAWFVFQKTLKGYSANKIALMCAERYSVPEPDAVKFATEIRTQLTKAALQSINIQEKAETAEWTEIPVDNYSVKHYLFGSTSVAFSFASAYLESFIHPLISHHQVECAPGKAVAFSLLEKESRIILLENNQVKGNWSLDESHLVKGTIFICLSNVLFGKSDSDWLMTIHASAITDQKKTILFTAAPGGGKTTMAALLQQQNYQLVSDDFVPVDREFQLAWPFPMAMSVKEGATHLLRDFYPELNSIEPKQLNNNKVVRYIQPNKSHQFSGQAYPVKELIFINYNAEVDFCWTRLDTWSAIRLLLKQTWISPEKGNAELFFDLVEKWSFYQLTYSDNAKALAEITKLFGND